MKLANVKAVRLEQGFPLYPRNSIISRYGTREQVPDKDKKIIVGLGCSHTWGHGLENKDSWPLQLQDLIDSKYQVLNMGRCSFGLKLLIDWYTFFADELNPFMCIFQIPDFMRQPIMKQFEDRRELYDYERQIEVYEWWLCSDYLKSLMPDEIFLNGARGRQTTGQNISLDY